MTPLGGSICGIPVLISDGVTVGNVILVDATGIGAGSADVGFAEYHEGSVQLDTAPDSPPTASTNVISMFQMNLVGLVVERWIVAARLRDNSVAIVNNANSYRQRVLAAMINSHQLQQTEASRQYSPAELAEVARILFKDRGSDLAITIASLHVDLMERLAQLSEGLQMMQTRINQLEQRKR